jgi:glutaredoxin
MNRHLASWLRPLHLPWLLPWLLGLLLALSPLSAPATPGPSQPNGATLEVFVREGCPHCTQAKAFLPELQRQHPDLIIRLRPLDTDPTALADLQHHAARGGIRAPGVPTFVLGNRVLVGFDGPAGRGRELLELIARQKHPQGRVPQAPQGLSDLQRLGLPAFTLALGLLDGFNPCAMWVLLFLLSLLVHWRDRRRLALVAGTFVLVSGAVYYAFMAAWLNVFLLLGLSRPLQLLLGSIALLIGLVNLRDASRQSGSYTLAIPEAAKPGIITRMRKVLQSRALAPALLGVAMLAVVVNLVELLCTAGLPAVYTAVLSQQSLPAWAHYSYLGLYILGYIADDALMVTLAVWALGNQRLSAAAGRQLKLVSAAVMLGLGLVLLLQPGWLI